MPRLLVLAAACAAIVAAPGGAAVGGPRDGSWPDVIHGWALAGPDLSCVPRADLCSTEDGGATWHGIFSGAVDQFARTSGSAGAVSVADGRVFWTRDDGRHWYRTTRIFGRFAGASNALFATSGTDVYRVTPWPPRRRARCSAWRVVARVNGRAVSTVCSGSAVEAGMNDRLLGTANGTTIGALTAIPGGVFGVSDYEPDYSRLNVFVWRHGTLVQSALPFPQPAWWCCVTADAAWPSLYVNASLYSPPGTAGPPVPVVWSSHDGGASFSVYVKR